MASYPLVMTAQQARSVHDDGILHLQTFAYLRAQSAKAPRTAATMRNLWLLLPKHHHMQKMIRTMDKERINAYHTNLLAAESFVGTCGKVTRMPDACIKLCL